ncbi:PQQ-binding-like beta-propeller repeat protein [Streptosporangium sp. NPDC002544]|uniref:outer membrane protein assembly factor BamB family protein n=1 Tax=Streptosporangium sp. NPDC002544 TaxID=3154538 RepID=UPI0033302F7A
MIGKTLWERQLHQRGSASALAVTEDRVVLHERHTRLVCLDRHDCSVRWDVPIGTWPRAVVVASDRCLVLPQDTDQLFCLDLTTGSVARRVAAILRACRSYCGDGRRRRLAWLHTHVRFRPEGRTVSVADTAAYGYGASSALGWRRAVGRRLRSVADRSTRWQGTGPLAVAGAIGRNRRSSGVHHDQP